MRAPHDYGVAVILLGAADRVVPAAQTDALREAVRQYSGGVRARRRRGQVAGAGRIRGPHGAHRQIAGTIEDPDALRDSRDVVHLGARLLPYINGYASAPALSVSKSPKPSAPVFLLHGIDDNIIPSIESEYLAEDLRPYAPVRLLQSGLISHAEADRPFKVGDVLQLAGFWGDLLSR